MIRVTDVSKKFGDFAALNDVSVNIPSGALTALLGPSGGGKSTLLRIIAGLEQPDTGIIEIEGEESTNLSPQRRGVGFVFQHYAAFKHMTVFGNVAFGLEIRKRPKAEIKKRVNELLELVHLEQFVDARPDLGLGALADLEAEGDVAPHREVLERGVVLEDEADAAFLRHDVRDVVVADHDPADVGHLEAEGHVAVHAEVLERGVVLEDEAHVAPLRRQTGGVGAGDDDRARVGLLQPGDDP